MCLALEFDDSRWIEPVESRDWGTGKDAHFLHVVKVASN
jgi:hypothetical protein